jgi:hypothetical protein
MGITRKLLFFQNPVGEHVVGGVELSSAVKKTGFFRERNAVFSIFYALFLAGFL